jgi:hypothetical protein
LNETRCPPRLGVWDADLENLPYREARVREVGVSVSGESVCGMRGIGYANAALSVEKKVKKKREKFVNRVQLLCLHHDGEDDEGLLAHEMQIHIEKAKCPIGIKNDID